MFLETPLKIIRQANVKLLFCLQTFQDVNAMHRQIGPPPCGGLFEGDSLRRTHPPYAILLRVSCCPE